MARCLAAAISQAPGLSGTPDSGHCSRAATRASCARSSATPTSHTIRVSPAMSLGDSILQTASMAPCVSVVVTPTDHITFTPSAQVEAPSGRERSESPLPKSRAYFAREPCALWLLPDLTRPLLCVLSEVLRPEQLPNLGLALPSWPVLFVKFHKLLCRLDRLLLRIKLELGISADNFLGFGEGPIDDLDLSSGEPHARALRSWSEPTASQHPAFFDRFFSELSNGVHQLLGRSALILGMLDQHHESHRHISLLFRFGTGTVEQF